MRKRMLEALDAWGYYLLALLCAAAILLSAVWTNRADEQTTRDMSAAADKNERLSDVQFKADALAAAQESVCPCAGAIARGYSADMVYFDALGMWRTHEALDFACGETDEVRAMRAGRVIGAANGDVTIDHGDGSISVYRGVRETVAEVNVSVAAGDVIARGGTPLHGSESGVCVSVRREGITIDFFDWFGINRD